MLQELEVLRTCNHPHIMGVLEMLEDHDNYYIACEILEGGELFDKLMEVG